MDQAIARGIRAFSHNDLLEKKDSMINVDIFLYCAIPNSNEQKLLEKSIDYMLYKTSYDKDLKIKEIEQSIKLNSFDCGLNYKRNLKKDFDMKRECNYKPCDYNCKYFEGPFL